MKSKGLCYLTNNTNENWISGMSENQIQVESYRSYLKNLITRDFYKIIAKFRLPIVSVLAKKEHAKLLDGDDFDGIICIAKKEKKTLMKILDIFETDYRIVLWYWDSISANYAFEPEKCNFKRVESWSFDLDDCSNFKMRYNNQFYYNNLIPCNRDIFYEDLFLVAHDRGRASEIVKWVETFDKLGLKSKIVLIKDSSSKGEFEYMYSNEKMKYSEIIAEIGKSKAILEILCEGQSGLSLRTMESIFYECKLITNNLSIKKYDIYDPNNIFILGEDDIQDLNDFINTPYKKLSENLLRKYKISRWIEQFNVAQ